MSIYDWLETLNLSVKITGELDPIKHEGFINVKLHGMKWAVDNIPFGRSGWEPNNSKKKNNWPCLHKAMEDLCKKLSGTIITLVDGGALKVPNILYYYRDEWSNEATR